MINNNILQGITWGNWFYVNAQFVIRLVELAQERGKVKPKVQRMIAFAHAVTEQKKIKLYKELAFEVKDILEVEKLVQKGEVAWEDTKVFSYLCEKILYRFACPPKDN